MKSLNEVKLIGNLGKDPEVKYTAGGDAVVNFSLATSESWKDKNSGEMQERTEWHRCVAWRKVGEIIAQYVKKGQKLYVAGKLQTRKWEQDGQTRYATEIQVQDVMLLSAKGEGGGSGERAGTGSQNYRAIPAGPEPAAPAQAEDFDDGIPF